MKGRELARAGPKNAALLSLIAFVGASGVLPEEALLDAIRSDPVGRQIPLELFEGIGPGP